MPATPVPEPERPRTPGARRRPAPGAEGNLPARPGSFVGRGRETAELADALGTARLVTVTGPGGVGKTRLALHVARQVQDRFCDGVWLAGLSGVADGALLEETVAGALGITAPPGRSPRAALLDRLRRRSALLVLDSCEHLTEHCAELTGALLRHAPGLRVLVVSRRALEVTGEHRLALGPLSQEESVALFLARAASVRARTRPAPPRGAENGGHEAEQARTVAALCRRLDGLPLALELAAGRLATLTLEQIAAGAEDRFRLLTGGGPAALPRHRTLRTAIGWSHELCTAQERLLWARLSVFAGGFDLEAAEYLCTGGGLDAEQVPGVLASLVAQSVVVREGSGSSTGGGFTGDGSPGDGSAGLDAPVDPPSPTGQTRYRLLETVREYGARWLLRLGEDEWLRRRHRDWYLGLATWCELEWYGPRQPELAARIEQELPNLRQALRCSLESAEEAHTGRFLASALWFYWIGCGRLTEGAHWLERALSWEGGRPGARAKTLWVSGLTAVLRGETVRARHQLHECLGLAAAAGDTRAAAYATQTLGCLALLRGESAQAKALLNDALDRFRRLGELNTLVLLALAGLGMAHLVDGEVDSAVALGEEARDIAADNGERWALSFALYVLAQARTARGEHEQARALGVECLTIKRELHDVLGMTMALEALAPLTVEAGPERAAELLGAAVSGWRRLGARHTGTGYLGERGRECRERAVAALGSEAYLRARRRGEVLGLQALVSREVTAHEPAPATAPPPAGEPPEPPRPTGPAEPADSTEDPGNAGAEGDAGAGHTATGVGARHAPDLPRPALPPPPTGDDGGGTAG